MTRSRPETQVTVHGVVRLADRATWIRRRPGRDAAVALPLVDHPDHGRVLVVSTRARINGHTQARMSHAGDVVLLGGALEGSESAERAAVRELREETGTADLLAAADLPVEASLGLWTTESGFAVAGFLVRAPHAVVTEGRPDPREVEELVLVAVEEVYAARPHLALHRVDAADRAGVLGAAARGDWLFESPTLVVRDVRGTRRVLWGVAGHMVTQLRGRFPTPGLLPRGR